MEEILYVIQWLEPHGEPTGIGTEIEEYREIIASDIDWILVRSYDVGTLERITAKWPGWSLEVRPANGQFVDIGGAEMEVENGILIDG